MSIPELSRDERRVYEDLCKRIGVVGNNIEEISLETIATECLGLHKTHASLKKAYDTVKQLRDKGYITADFGWHEIANVKTHVQITEQPVHLFRSTDQSFALVMKGGSVKGLAYVGALKELEKYYRFDWFVGTSAGAIAAVLLAAGYTSNELETILTKKSFRDFLDAAFYRLPTNYYFHHGFFPGYTLVNWIDHLLATKLGSGSRVKLKDLPTRVTIYASRRDEDTLVFDSHDPETMNTYASFAVRCSMAIPIVFMPQDMQGMRVLDGGMRNNYPVEALLRDHPDIKFLGLYLGPRTYEGNARKDREGSLVGNLLAIWTESSNWKALEKYREQTIIIDCRPINTLNFKLSDREKKFLIQAGRAAALEYLAAHLPKAEKLGIDKSEAEAARIEVEQTRKLLSSSRHWWNRIWTRSALVFLLLSLHSQVTA